MTVHTKIQERRREVAEEKAKRSLGRLLRLVLVVVPVAVTAWLAFSPFLSASTVVVEGAEAGAVYEVLARHGVVVGTPMILLDVSRVEESLEEDPWIARAEVSLLWPDEVSVSIVEREPLAWVQTDAGWARHSLDGSSLPSPAAPDGSLPSVLLPQMGEREAMKSTELLGALEWLDALPRRLRGGLVVTLVDGELWADVAGHRVRLGRPVEMTAKAMSLGSLLSEQLPEGSEINLLAPTHPAVGPPDGGGED